MKKIIFGLLIAFVALSFMGCPTVHEDAEFKVITLGYLSGDMTEWDQNDNTKITWVLGTGVATGSIEFTVTEEKEYGFNVCDKGWQNKYGSTKLVVGKDFVELEPWTAYDAPKIKLTAGTYVFMLESDSSKVKAKVVKK